MENVASFDHICSFFLCSAGIPFGSVNLLYGVDEHESKASTFHVLLMLPIVFFCILPRFESPLRKYDVILEFSCG